MCWISSFWIIKLWLFAVGRSTYLTCLTLLTFLPRSETAPLRTALAVSVLPPLWRLAVLHPWCRFTSRWCAVSTVSKRVVVYTPSWILQLCCKWKNKRFQPLRTYRDVTKARRTEFDVKHGESRASVVGVISISRCQAFVDAIVFVWLAKFEKLRWSPSRCNAQHSSKLLA